MRCQPHICPRLPAALAWLAPALQVWHAVRHAGNRHLAHPGHVSPLALQRCSNSASQDTCGSRLMAAGSTDSFSAFAGLLQAYAYHW
jgi:hypothetical protein